MLCHEDSESESVSGGCPNHWSPVVASVERAAFVIKGQAFVNCECRNFGFSGHPKGTYTDGAADER